MSNSFTATELDDCVVSHSKATRVTFYFFFKFFTTLEARKTLKRTSARRMVLLFPSKT